MNAVRRGYLYAFSPTRSGASSRCTSRRCARPARSRSWPTGWSGRSCSSPILIAAARRWRAIAALRHQRRKLAGIGLAAAFIAVNWGIYIYGVNTNHVVETSLGYFINPLVTVLLGVLALHERLRSASSGSRWASAAVAVVVLTIDYGRLPWIALALAFSFGMYGFVKKRLGLPATDGLFLESSVLVLPALAYLIVLGAQGHSTFGHGSPWHTVGLC